MFSEVRSATRGLRRWRGSAVAVLTLAIGIGTTTAVSVLLRVLVADLPGVPDASRLARVYAASPSLGVERSSVALNEFDSTLSKATSFQAIGAYADEDAAMGTGLDAASIVAGYASPGFFTAVGVPPAAGRVFTAGDLQGPPVVILSDALWRRQFPDGRLRDATVVVDGVERAVVGVMPPEFHYPFVGIEADLWVPLASARSTMPSIVAVYARLRDGVGWPAAHAELTALSRGGGQWAWRAIPVADDTRTRTLAAFAGALGPALLVLLIACVNVACLLMARGIERDTELGVRRALGATRAQVARTLLGESLLLALAGGALGAALAAGILRVLTPPLAAAQPALARGLTLDVRMLAVALGASALSCVLFGVVPALQLSKRNVAACLKGMPLVHRVQIAGYGARDAVVFAEIALAVGFIVWTSMVYAFVTQLGAIAPTFPADRIVAMRVPARDVREVAARVAAVPGVARTAVSSGLLGGGLRERVAAGGARSVIVSRVPVGDGFLDTLGVPLVRGRSFDAAELAARAGVAVLTESGARQLAPGRDAVGLRLQTSGHGELVVIGVCRDPLDYGALSAVDGFAAEMYVPYEAPVGSPEAVVLARVSADPHAALRAIAAAAGAPPGAKPARPIVLSDDFGHRGGAGMMVAARALGSFAILTLLLAASGVFAVVTQSVAQRTREFGIRIAIGATPSRVLVMVLARETTLVGAAVATGALFTMLATRALFTELTSLSFAAPSAWLSALAWSGGVAAIAVAFATLRIVRLEPGVILQRT